jgi:hypothetical protein
VHTDELEGLLPTEADVVFYAEHGYRVTRKVLPDDVVDAAQRGAERHVPGEPDWGLPVDGIRSSEFEGPPYPALSSDL